MTVEEMYDEHMALQREILAELQQLNQNLTSRSTSDRLNDEMDLVK